MDSFTCTAPAAPAAAADHTDTTIAGPPTSGAGTELTFLTKAGGPLTKRIALDAAGRVVSDGSACVMAEGRAERLRLAGPADLAAVARRHGARPGARPRPPPRRPARRGARRHPARARRAARPPRAPSPARATTSTTRPASRPSPCSTSTARACRTRSPRPSPTRGGFWPALVAAVPALARAARVRRASTSAGLLDLRTGAPVGAGAGGEHVYLLVRDGADVERFLRDLHERCWLHGLGWFLVGAAGQLLERSVVDRTVGAPERLVFEGAPVLEPPLGQDLAARAPEWSDGEALDTRAACPPLTRVERARVAELKEAARAALAPEAATGAGGGGPRRSPAASRSATACRPPPPCAWPRRGTAASCCRMSSSPSTTRRSARPPWPRCCASPTRFVGETLADPLEGVAYGRCKAKVMRRADGSLWIHSFAHGRTTYELKLDAAALEAALRGTEPPAAVVDAYVAAPARGRAGARRGGAPLRAGPRAVRREGAAAGGAGARGAGAAGARRGGRAAPGGGRGQGGARARAGGRRRVRLPAPLPDDERTPVLLALDEVLGAAPDPEPPMRNADGVVAEIRARRPWGLHGLTDAGADAEEAPEDRLPPPEEPLITALDPVGLGLLVERHIEHDRDGEGRTGAGGLAARALPARLPGLAGEPAAHGAGGGHGAARHARGRAARRGGARPRARGGVPHRAGAAGAGAGRPGRHRRRRGGRGAALPRGRVALRRGRRASPAGWCCSPTR